LPFYLLLTNDRAASKLRDIIKYDNTGVVFTCSSEIIIILEAVLLLNQLKCVREALFATNLNIQYFDD